MARNSKSHQFAGDAGAYLLDLSRVLLQAGFAELDLAIPWWGGRRLRFRFP